MLQILPLLGSGLLRRLGFQIPALEMSRGTRRCADQFGTRCPVAVWEGACTLWETVLRVFVCLAIDETRIVPPRGHYKPLSAAFLELNCRRREFPAPARRHQACPRKRPLQKSLNNSQMMRTSNIYRGLLSWAYNNGCCQRPLASSSHTQSEQLRCKTLTFGITAVVFVCEPPPQDRAASEGLVREKQKVV